jgi:lipoprotein-releasing system permease protein
MGKRIEGPLRGAGATDGRAGAIGWVGFVARRYARRRKGSGGASFFLPVCGIAVGVLALTVILAVMNGFQMGFIESILEISSYHIRVELSEAERAEEAALLLMNGNTGRFVKSVIPYEEVQGIIREPDSGRQQAAVVRALPADALLTDQGMAEKLIMERGTFNLHDPNAILLGAEGASRLGVRLGETVTLLSLAGMLPHAEDNGEGDGGTLDSSFVVRGIFRSGFYEYDLGWAFIGLERAREMEPGIKLTLGVKIGDRFADRETAALIEKALAEHGIGAKVTSWRDYNKAFFGALRTEKLFMFILVGLIFIVVGIQIFQSQRRLVLERSDEIGLLRAVGAGVFEVRCIFTLGGFIIGGIGALTGTVLAVLIARNIAPLFGALENAVNFIAGALSGGGRFAVFSPAIFYIKDIPSRLIPQEVLAIFLFGFGSAVFAGWFASKRVTSIKPAEVLRYE